MASNHPRVHWLKTVVLSVVGDVATGSRQVGAGKMSDGPNGSLPLTRRKTLDDVETRAVQMSWDQSGGYPFTAQAASGVQAA